LLKVLVHGLDRRFGLPLRMRACFISQSSSDGTLEFIDNNNGLGPARESCCPSRLRVFSQVASDVDKKQLAFATQLSVCHRP
jgi:hypothetical protein